MSRIRILGAERVALFCMLYGSIATLEIEAPPPLSIDLGIRVKKGKGERKRNKGNRWG
jgi:hypothetical protein